MIPFSKLLQYGNVIDTSKLLDIDFSTADVGSTAMIDNTNHSNFTAVGAGGVVEYDSVLQSNVMKFSGTGRYVTAMNSYINLVQKNFEINLVFKTTATNAQCPWCTGDWNGNRIPGINFSLNAETANYLQYFIDNGAGFNRIIFGGPNQQVWENVTLRCTSTEMQVINHRLGTTTSYPRYAFSAGTFLSIGGSYTGGSPNYFVGSIQKFSIRSIE